MPKQVKVNNLVTEPESQGATAHFPGELVDASKFPDLAWLIEQRHVEWVQDTPEPSRSPVRSQPIPSESAEVANG